MGDQRPFRHRHDGWTPERQLLFLANLAATGVVADACRAAGLSTTNAYRTYKRLPDFAARWDMALSSRRAVLEQAAFERAVCGVERPLVSAGKVVAITRRYSDSLLRYMLERDDKRAGARAERAATQEQTDAALAEKLDALALRLREEERRTALAFAERMRAEGKCP